MSIETLPALRPKRAPWNKGRIVGQKRPLLPKHVWSIRVRLKMSDSERDLALFDMAIDYKLRGCDLVCLTVNDVYAAGRVKESASVTQSKARKLVPDLQEDGQPASCSTFARAYQNGQHCSLSWGRPERRAVLVRRDRSVTTSPTGVSCAFGPYRTFNTPKRTRLCRALRLKLICSTAVDFSGPYKRALFRHMPPGPAAPPSGSAGSLMPARRSASFATPDGHAKSFGITTLPEISSV